MFTPLVHLDFDERHQEELVVGSAIPPRWRALVSLLAHVFIATALVAMPRLTIFQLTPEEEAQRLEELRRRERPPEERTFVFVQPRVDLEALRPPERGEASDKDRVASSPVRKENPTNSMPYAEGNSRERVETPPVAPPERARGPESQAPPSPGEANQAQRQPAAEPRYLPPGDNGLTLPQASAPQPQPQARAGGGALGEALRNLQRYVQNESFDNRGGGDSRQFGPFLQFDTKGVEFGPWVRRFVAQVKRNWLIPYAAMTMRGHVVLQFNVHKDGRITDLAIVGPSDIEGFNHSSANAILASNPTEPLPPEYPADKAFFTVTFYYNEEPPGR